MSAPLVTRIVLLHGMKRTHSAVFDGELIVAPGRTHAETGRRIARALATLSRAGRLPLS